MNYVKPELIVVAVALYFLGMALKQAQAVKDKYIPLILGGVSIVLCAIWVLATSEVGTGQQAAMAVFTAVTQGILVAGLSNYSESDYQADTEIRVRAANNRPFLRRRKSAGEREVS